MVVGYSDSHILNGSWYAIGRYLWVLSWVRG